VATPVIIEVKANASQARREFDGLSQSFKAFGASVRSVVAMSSQAVTGIRQMAQGIQNLGFTMSAMIGLPVTAALKTMTSEAVDFEKKLVEVEKTTGLAKSQVGELGKELRELAMSTPTSAKDLAELAAEAGRAGVGLGQTLAGNVQAARQEILEFVRVMDMMQVSTTLTGEAAAEAFSRFITLFADIDTSNIENLGSAINELGQATSVSEDEIVGAMLRIAPAASTLGLSASEVAGLATAITQMSESMSRGGTRVRVALEQMTINYKEAAKLIGVSTEEMAKKLNEEALPTFIELVYAIGQIEDATTSTKVAADIFGTTGANAVKRFAAAYPELQMLMELSNQSFEDGTSLQREFDRALTSTSAQFDILKNAIMEAGYTFMQDLLPIAQEIISALIPAVQELTEWVKSLTTEQKLLAVGIAALVVVGLPLLALLGSLGFGFAMIINGAVNLIGGLVGLLATVLTFGGGLSFLTTILGGLAAVIGGALIVNLLKSGDAFDKIIEKLQEVADGALDWGESLIANIAEGIVRAAASVLVQALEFVGNIISSFLESHSPPDTGPLSTINEWGTRLIDTYLQGFKKADFSILKDVAGIISNVLRNMVDIGKINEIDFGPMLANARTFVAELIDVFNKTGVIAEDVLAKIGDMLGGAGDEIVKLLRLQLQYNKALKDLEDIRSKKADIQEAYEAEARAILARTDLTEAEKLAAIMTAKKRRDLAMTNADTEEAAAQESVDGLKEQVEWQREYIGAMMDQDSVLVDHLKLIEKLSKVIQKAASSIKSLADKIADLIADLLRQLEINERLKELYESKGMDTTPLLRKELSLRKRLIEALMEKKLMYEDMNKELPEAEWMHLSEEEEKMLNDNIDRIKELEATLDMDPDAINIQVDTDEATAGAEAVQESIKKLKDLGDTVNNTLAKGKGLWDAFKRGLTGVDLPKPKTDFKSLGLTKAEFDALTPEELQQLVPPLDESMVKFHEWGAKIKETWDKVKTTIDEIGAKWEEFKSKIGSIFGDVKKEFGGIEVPDAMYRSADQLAAVEGRFSEVGDSFKKYAPIILSLGAAILFLRKPLSGLSSWLLSPKTVGLLGDALGGLGSTIGDLATASATKGSAVKKGLGGAFETLYLKGLFLIDGIKGIPTALAKLPGALGGKLLGGIKTFFGLFTGGISSIGPMIGSVVSGIAGAATTIGSFVGTITLIGGAVAAIGVAVGVAIAYIRKNWSEFKDKFLGIWDNIKQAFSGFVDNIKQALGLGGAGGEGIKFADILQKIYDKAEPVAKFLAGAFTKALQVISGLLKIILPALGKAFGGIFRGIAAVAGGILDVLGGIFQAIEGIWNGITKGDWSLLEGAWEKLKTGVLEILGGLGTAIAGVFLGIGDTIMGIIGSIVDGIGNVFGMTDLMQKIKGFVDGIIGWFQWLWEKLIGRSIIPDIVEGIKKWFEKLLKPFQPVFDAIKRFVDYLKMAWKFVSKAFTAGGAEKGFAALLKVIGPFKKVLGPVIKVFYQLYKVVSPIIDALKTGFKEGGIKGAFEAIKKVLPDVIKNLGKLLGSMMTMIPKMLIGLAQMLWPWITGTLIPWVTSVVSTVWEYLKTNVPIWITVLLTVLGELAAKLWAWIQEVAIPWIVAFAQMIWAYLKENVPQWIVTIVEVLGILASKLWEFITTTLIPWAIDLIQKVWDIIKEKGPGWLEKIKEILVTIITALWNFITTDLIPWIASVIVTVVDYLKENGPQWLATLAEVMKLLSRKLWAFILETVVPWLRDLIKKGVTWLGKIATSWWAKIKEGLDKIKQYFVDIFEGIKEIVMGAIKGAINGMITFLEDGINKIIEGINSFIKTINKVLRSVGIGELGLIGKVSIPRLAKGGIALQEQLAIVGDVPEAIIPLDKLSGMVGNTDRQTPSINITIKDNTVRSDEDLDRIVSEISRRLGTKLDAKIRTVGVRSINI